MFTGAQKCTDFWFFSEMKPFQSFSVKLHFASGLNIGMHGWDYGHSSIIVFLDACKIYIYAQKGD